MRLQMTKGQPEVLGCEGGSAQSTHHSAVLLVSLDVLRGAGSGSLQGGWAGGAQCFSAQSELLSTSRMTRTPRRSLEASAPMTQPASLESLAVYTER